MGVYATVSVWRSESDFRELVSSFHCGIWGTSSGHPPACVASIFSTEQSWQLVSLIFLYNSWYWLKSSKSYRVQCNQRGRTPSQKHGSVPCNPNTTNRRKVMQVHYTLSLRLVGVPGKTLSQNHKETAMIVIHLTNVSTGTLKTMPKTKSTEKQPMLTVWKS